MWQEQIAELRGAYHCLAPDLPEHGGSMAVTPFSIAGCAQQIADLIQERAQGGKAHVVGLSLGAQVAVAPARRRAGKAALGADQQRDAAARARRLDVYAGHAEIHLPDLRRPLQERQLVD